MASHVFRLLSSPSFTGTLLVALSWGPDRVTAPFLEVARARLSENTLSTIITTLKYLFSLGLAGEVNRLLNLYAKNNFRMSGESYDWPNEVVVITGGTGGFGSLMSKRFADQGATVVALDVKNSLPDNLKGNAKIHYVQCDITDRQEVMNVRDRIVKDYGHASVLINNAGLGLGDVVLECKEQEIRKIVDVNYVSHWWTVQAFLPGMLEKRKGHVVTIASMASFIGPPTMSMYSSTKAALLAFHEALTGELRVYHKTPEIKTTIVHPTWSHTAMVSAHVDRIRKAGMDLIPPQQVADAVVDQVLSGRGGGRLVVSDFKGRVPEYLRSAPLWLVRTLMKA